MFFRKICTAVFAVLMLGAVTTGCSGDTADVRDVAAKYASAADGIIIRLDAAKFLEASGTKVVEGKPLTLSPDLQTVVDKLPAAHRMALEILAKNTRIRYDYILVTSHIGKQGSSAIMIFPVSDADDFIDAFVAEGYTRESGKDGFSGIAMDNWVLLAKDNLAFAVFGPKDTPGVRDAVEVVNEAAALAKEKPLSDVTVGRLFDSSEAVSAVIALNWGGFRPGSGRAPGFMSILYKGSPKTCWLTADYNKSESNIHAVARFYDAADKLCERAFTATCPTDALRFCAPGANLVWYGDLHAIARGLIQGLDYKGLALSMLVSTMSGPGMISAALPADLAGDMSAIYKMQFTVAARFKGGSAALKTVAGMLKTAGLNVAPNGDGYRITLTATEYEEGATYEDEPTAHTVHLVMDLRETDGWLVLAANCTPAPLGGHSMPSAWALLGRGLSSQWLWGMITPSGVPMPDDFSLVMGENGEINIELTR